MLITVSPGIISPLSGNSMRGLWSSMDALEGPGSLKIIGRLVPSVDAADGPGTDAPAAGVEVPEGQEVEAEAGAAVPWAADSHFPFQRPLPFPSSSVSPSSPSFHH